ncbi:MAG: glutamine cyclotransferase [Verrucomicrobia bacterium]|nr:glutamine cyclotransferase [Verrucomicrobiota bacterium]
MKNANPVSGRLLLVIASLTALAACGKSSAAKTPSIPALSAAADAHGTIPQFSYEVVAAWPHDRQAFTQGLVFRNGSFLESTGLNGQSSLREVDVKSGRIIKRVTVAPEYFAEGLAVLGDRAYQLTWRNGRGFVYDADTFHLEKTFSYDGEGWGLTTDGHDLVLSDGSARIRFIDPENFHVVRTIDVTVSGKPLDQLNELEWIHGEILANVWQTNEVVRIDPATGQVRGIIDFTGLLPSADRERGTDVLNGIAYDPATDRLFVTGKNWPKVFEVRLKAK